MRREREARRGGTACPSLPYWKRIARPGPATLSVELPELLADAQRVRRRGLRRHARILTGPARPAAVGAGGRAGGPVVCGRLPMARAFRARADAPWRGMNTSVWRSGQERNAKVRRPAGHRKVGNRLGGKSLTHGGTPSGDDCKKEASTPSSGNRGKNWKKKDIAHERIGRRKILRIRIIAKTQVTTAELLKLKTATFASRIKSLRIVHATRSIRQFLPS